MNIAIIEYESNIEEALRHFSPQDTLYLSVSAEASYYLSERGIKFLTDEEALTPEEFKKIGDENFKITEDWVGRLEGALRSRSPLFEERGLRPFKSNFYRLKILLDAVRVRRVLLERLIEKEGPSSMGAPFGADAGKIRDHHLFFYKQDSLYGLLAEKIASRKGINIKTWSSVTFAGDKRDFKRAIAGTLARSNQRVRKGLKVLSGIMPGGRNKKEGNILLGALGYDIKPLVEKYSKRFNFYRLFQGEKEPLSIASLDSFFKMKPPDSAEPLPALDMEGAFRNVGVTGDAVVDEILGQRVQRYAETFIPFLWKGLNYLESADRKLDFKAYVDSAGASDALLGLPVDYFTRKRKGLFVVQHGGYGYALNRHTEHCEFGHDGCFLAWGDGVEEMYGERKNGDCRIVSTGSHLIGEIKRQRKARRKIKQVCYVPGLYRGYTSYYPNGQPWLDSRMFLMETRFLSALKPYRERYRFTYKVSPAAVSWNPSFGRNFMLEWVRENLPWMRIESRPLPSVIHKFDLFIIDFPTTILVQAAASGAEVLVYGGNPYHPLSREARRRLKKRAAIGDDEDDFIDKIGKILDRGLTVSDIEDSDFLEKYGLYRDDKESLRRMAECIYGE